VQIVKTAFFQQIRTIFKEVSSFLINTKLPMAKHTVWLALFLILNKFLLGQTASGKLTFEQGRTFNIQMEIKTSITQQAGGQAIDFTVDGQALHSYKVTNATDDNTTLQHKANKIGFKFDGMGQKRSFDSDNEKDMNGPFGETVKNILSKSFNVIIDPNGKALMIQPEKTEAVNADERLAIVFTMLKDITDVAYPPKKGEASFFKILPDKPTNKGESWTESGQNENGKFSNDYTLTEITDSTIIVDFKGTAVTATKATMMGMETSTTMNSTSSGKIILDKTTGIIKEKTTTTESNGNTEAMGGSMPVTSKTTITVYVKPQ
jgi:Family of unknown function (DUF6263)